jgi:hypothetical protein
MLKLLLHFVLFNTKYQHNSILVISLLIIKVAAVNSYPQKETLLRINYVYVPFMLVNIVSVVNTKISGAILFIIVRQPPVGKCLLFIEDSWSLRRPTLGRTPLDEWSARRSDLYLTKKQHLQDSNIRAPGGIRTHSPNKRAAADHTLDRELTGTGSGSITDIYVYLH